MLLKSSHALPSFTAPKLQPEIHIYCDSDWAGCKQTRRSTTGTATQLSGCTDHFCSRAQATVALSSTEAETLAIGTGTSEALYLHQLLDEINLFGKISFHIHSDPTGATATCTRTGLSPKTKHTQLRYLWLQPSFTTQQCNLHKIEIAANLGDVLTKYVTSTVLERLLGRLGLIEVTSYSLGVPLLPPFRACPPIRVFTLTALLRWRSCMITATVLSTMLLASCTRSLNQ